MNIYAVNSKLKFEELLNQEKRMSMPIMTNLGINLTGESVFDAVTKGEAQYNAMKVLAENYPSIAAVSIMDLTVEAEAFGSSLIFSKNELPAISGRLVYDSKSILDLKIPDLKAGRLPEYLKAVKLAKENINDKLVFGSCIGPFSLAGRLFDMTEIMTAVYLEPVSIKLLIEKCSEFLSEYIGCMKKTGINGILMAEPAAGLLDHDLCEIFSSSFINKIVKKYQDDSFIIVLHNCGNTGHVTKSMIDTEAKGLHFGNKININSVLKEVPDDRIVLGNLNPVSIFQMLTPYEIKQKVLELLNNTRDFSNFVISSGCDLPPGVPIENIEAFFEAVDEFNN